MNLYEIIKYNTNYFSIWNNFVSVSKNATFLFHRDFMEYHQDRFEDYSLLIYYKNKLVALLPANIKEGTLYSHQGLSYGGLVYFHLLKFQDIFSIFKYVLEYLHNIGISQIYIKQLPSIYSSCPNGELSYLMYLVDSKLTRRDTLSVIDYRKVLKLSKDRLHGIKRGNRNNLVVKEESDFEPFWNDILIPSLKEKYNVEPVHSLEEIEKLKKHFPNQIRQFNVYKDRKIVAGTTIFETKYVAHSQYISSNTDKNILGSLDFLYNHLVNKVFSNKRFFDFGISNECKGRHVNKGLLYWKEGFGARTLTQDFYLVSTNNYKLLDTVLI